MRELTKEQEEMLDDAMHGKLYTARDIEKMIKLYCCHTSGMHDPVHFQQRSYICESQKARALERLCQELGIDPATKSDPDCGWCIDYPEKKTGEGLKMLEEKELRQKKK